MSATQIHAPVVATLECSHCGSEAIESDDGTFGDGDGDACMTCGYPGHVIVTEAYDANGDEYAYAYWACRDGNDDTCNDPCCTECSDVRVAFGLADTERPTVLASTEQPK